jgi:hypothetical protein
MLALILLRRGGARRIMLRRLEVGEMGEEGL